MKIILKDDDGYGNISMKFYEKLDKTFYALFRVPDEKIFRKRK